jgi:hypothetical protein
MSILRIGVAFATLAISATALAQVRPPDPTESDDPDAETRSSFRFGGYAQPQLRFRQNDAVAQFDENGFSLRRSRFTIAGAKATVHDIRIDFELESELTPEFQLLDALVAASGTLANDGRWRVDFGQVKAPFSRQELISDAEVQFVGKADLVSLAPGRQLGLRGTINLPMVPMIELSGGWFNGEGRNQLDNIDEKFMYVGRLAIRPIGHDAWLTEGPLGPDQLSFAVSAMRNTQDVGSFLETETAFGGDAFVSMYGISAYVEYLWRKTDFPDGASQIDFEQQGLNAQLGYLLPLPGFLQRKLEVAGRYQEFDNRFPNEEFPIEGPGDPNQATRSVQLGVNYYHDTHDLKAQLLVSKNLEVEDRDRNNMDATFDNDTILLQVTYRLE